MSTVGHSQLPWSSEAISTEARDELALSDARMWIVDGSHAQQVIATVDFATFGGDEVANANAAFIVRACNAHDDLLAALKAVTDALDSTRDVQLGNDAEGSAAVQQGRAAITRAEADV